MKRRHFIASATSVMTAATLPQLSCISPALARLRQPVTWGGAYLQTDAMPMPHLNQAMAIRNANNQNINQVLLETIRAINWAETDIDLAALIDQDTATTTEYGMVLVFVAEQSLGQVYFPNLNETRYIARLVGYNMVYNIKQRRIIANFGIRGRYLHAISGNPDPAALPEIYFELITNQDREGSIAKLMTEVVSQYPYSNRYGGKQFKVTSVHAKPLVATAAEKTDMSADIFRDQIGYLATVCFSENTEAPIIPYAKTATLNKNLIQEMRITAFDGNSALNTSLPLPDPDIGISVILDGWNFNENPVSNQRNEVSLTMSLTVTFQHQNDGRVIFSQQFFAQKEFYEIPLAKYALSRDARVYILHEETIDHIFAAISNGSIRSALYEGIELKTRSEATFLQAVTDDKKTYNNEYESILEILPYSM